MIEIIPLNFKNDEYLTLLSDKETIETNNCYITSISLLGKLLDEKTFPIKNRNIAIENILSFFSYIDCMIKRNDSTIVPIPRGVIDKYFTRDTYKKYMDYFNDNEILTKVPYEDGKFYEYSIINNKKVKGGRCMQYRMHTKYLQDDLCIAIFPIESNVKLEKDSEYNKKYEKTILKTQINYRDSILAEIKNYKLDILNNNINALRFRINAILNLNNKRFIKKGEKVDRIYHSFTNLSRISRKYLNIKGKTFYSLDIANCQPLLLCYYIISQGGVIDDNYLKACEDGLFYETLMDSEYVKTLNDEQYEEYRDEIKVSTYKCIYFDFKKGKPIVNKFAEMYPNTYYFLDNFYQTITDITMASILQNIEASIFNTIEPVKSNYYFTLFDAIYFNNWEDSISIECEIKEKFGKLGITPKLK